MFSKILRARVRLPLDTPLLRWIVLLDGITKEEEVVSIGYERLPSFCYHCGIVGHQGARCPMPEELKTNGYKPELGVLPTHFKDPRRWYLTASTGQTRRILRQDLPWGPPSSAALPAPKPNLQRQLAIIAHVAEEVDKLTVQDL
jgi:hypothetical protein